MPRVNINLADTNAGIPLLPEGQVEFSVGEPKPFARTNNKGDKTWGVMYQLVTSMPDGSPARIPHNLYLHNKESLSFVKQFLMACLGFDKNNREDEKSFNVQYGEESWIDVDWEGDVGTVTAYGSVYDAVKGTQVKAFAKVVPNKQTDELQNQFNFTVNR